MTKQFVVGYVLLPCLAVMTMHGSEVESRIKLTTSGNIVLSCSQEALKKSQELSKKDKVDKKSIATIVAYCDCYSARFSGNRFSLQMIPYQFAPTHPHYHYDLT